MLADFRFAVIGDSRGNDDGINTEILPLILEEIKASDAEFIVVVGDLITGSKHSDVHRERLLKWKAIVEKYDTPVYVVIGNHEIESELSEDIIRSIFEMPQNGPPRLKELVYSFDYQNAHFTIIDTAVYKDFHRIEGDQLEWLINDLDQNKKGPIFVFGHDPAYPGGPHKGSSLDRYPSERDRLWEIFQEQGVDVYF